MHAVYLYVSQVCGITGLSLGSLSGEVQTVLFSPDSALLAAASKEQVVVFNCHLGAEQHRVDKCTATVNQCTWSSDSGHLAVASDDGTVCVLEAYSGKSRALLRHKKGVNFGNFSPEGSQLVCCTNDRNLLVVWVSRAFVHHKLTLTHILVYIYAPYLYTVYMELYHHHHHHQ